MARDGVPRRGEGARGCAGRARAKRPHPPSPSPSGRGGGAGAASSSGGPVARPRRDQLGTLGRGVRAVARVLPPDIQLGPFCNSVDPSAATRHHYGNYARPRPLLRHLYGVPTLPPLATPATATRGTVTSSHWGRAPGHSTGCSSTRLAELCVGVAGSRTRRPLPDGLRGHGEVRWCASGTRAGVKSDPRRRRWHLQSGSAVGVRGGN